MYLDSTEKKLNTMINLKKSKDFVDYDLNQLITLTSYSGIWELKFKDKLFKMINIYNDDFVPLKYFWKDRYEQLSLNLWYEFTRDINALHFDVGSHTGIYTIIGNLDKKINNIISLEPYFLNFSRMLSNLKLNKIYLDNSFMVAASNDTGVAKFRTLTHIRQHTSGGSIQKEGNHNVNKTRLDDMVKGNQKIGSIKIDTEGHEYEALLGSENIIRNFKPHIIFEINKACAQNCINYLTEFGYSFFIIDDKKNKLIPLTKNNNTVKLDKEGINCLATVSPDKKTIKKYI
mgnify:CR=1 FL=1|tara:strand:- start:165 stop:1028 length:864 start_codon:yes stop_codon:yes gene_type:complete